MFRAHLEKEEKMGRAGGSYSQWMLMGLIGVVMGLISFFVRQVQSTLNLLPLSPHFLLPPRLLVPSRSFPSFSPLHRLRIPQLHHASSPARCFPTLDYLVLPSLLLIVPPSLFSLSLSLFNIHFNPSVAPYF